MQYNLAGEIADMIMWLLHLHSFTWKHVFSTESNVLV